MLYCTSKYLSITSRYPPVLYSNMITINHSILAIFNSTNNMVSISYLPNYYNMTCSLC